jgi:hypothetical protein
MSRSSSLGSACEVVRDAGTGGDHCEPAVPNKPEAVIKIHAREKR